MQEELNSSKRVCINFRFLTSLRYAASVWQCSLLCSLRKVPLEDASVSTHTHNPDPVGTDLDSSHVTTMTLTYVSDNAFIKIPHLFKGNWKLKYYIIKNIARNLTWHITDCVTPQKNCLLTSFTPESTTTSKKQLPKSEKSEEAMAPKQWLPRSNVLLTTKVTAPKPKVETWFRGTAAFAESLLKSNSCPKPKCNSPFWTLD